MKANPEKVNPAIAKKALEKAKDVGSSFSEYIVLHWRGTGNLAPDCDFKDLLEWYKINMPEEYEAKKR